MKSGPQMGMAVLAGYVLGRRRRMRLALMLGAAASTGGLGRGAGALMSRGRDAVGSSGVLDKVSPELSEITGMIRGELLDAGRSAAAAAVSGRIETLSDRLHERAESIRSPRADADDDGADDNGDEPSAGRDEPREEDEEFEPDEPDEAEEPEESEEPEEPPRREPRAATRARSSRSGTQTPVRRRR